MNDSDGATKGDLKQLEQKLGDRMDSQVTELRSEMREVMSEFTQEILNALSPEIQEIKGDVLELKATTARIENKLAATANKVDDHEI